MMLVFFQAMIQNHILYLIYVSLHLLKILILLILSLTQKNFLSVASPLPSILFQENTKIAFSIQQPINTIVQIDKEVRYVSDISLLFYICNNMLKKNNFSFFFKKKKRSFTVSLYFIYG
jgi:hypothetical protein